MVTELDEEIFYWVHHAPYSMGQKCCDPTYVHTATKFDKLNYLQKDVLGSTMSP